MDAGPLELSPSAEGTGQRIARMKQVPDNIRREPTGVHDLI